MTTWFVSRHPGAIEWARQYGLRVDRLVSHIDSTQVQAGDTVMGTLPVQLAAAVCQQGATYFHLTLDLPAHWRGRELNAEELRHCNARLEAFEVRPVPSP